MIYTAIVLFILIAATLLCFNKNSLKSFLLSPPLLINLFLLTYAVIGFYLFWRGNHYLLGVNFDYALNEAYFSIALFATAFNLAFLYLFKTGRVKQKFTLSSSYKPNDKFLILYSITLFFYSILRINEIIIPALNNFLAIIFNTLIVVIGYSIIHRAKWSAILGVLFTTLVIYLGFRYRLILFFLPILLYIFAKKNISALNIAKFSMVIFISFGVVAIVGVAREYSSGLQLDRLGGLGIDELLINGIFNDTSTVMITGALIDHIRYHQNVAYFNQIYYILSYFIPSGIFSGKTYSPIIDYMSILTNQNNNESGVAAMAIAEYYHTAGYFGVCGFGILFAIVFMRLYKKAMGSGDSYYFFSYFAIVAWYLSSLTRGYFPQNFQDLISITIGLYIIKKKFYQPPKNSTKI